MGEKLQNLKPREAKPYTRAKWEIRFQRFALSFRPSAKARVCGMSREVKPYTRGNEKFHLSQASQNININEIIGKTSRHDPEMGVLSGKFKTNI